MKKTIIIIALFTVTAVLAFAQYDPESDFRANPWMVVNQYGLPGTRSASRKNQTLAESLTQDIFSFIFIL
jgi:hypothetical protein